MKKPVPPPNTKALPKEDTDELTSSQAPLLDHLIELRHRLIVCLSALILGFIVCLLIVTLIFEALIIPFHTALEKVNSTRALTSEAPLSGDLIYTQVLEFFFVKLKIALFGSVVLMFPVLCTQVYAFIAPGLYKNERRVVLPYLILSPLLFLLGSCLVFFYVFPHVLVFGLSGGQTLGTGASIALLPKISEYLKLATTLFIAFGLSFQLPILLVLLVKVGILSLDALRKGRRFAIVGIALFAAFVTPPDPLSQLFLGVCIYILYEMAVLFVRLTSTPVTNKQK